MNKINYLDYLSTCSNEQLIATNCIIDPRSIGNPRQLDFSFKLMYNEQSLETQSLLFLDEFRKDPDLVRLLDTFSSIPFSDRDNFVQNAYKYSYFKVIKCILDIYDNGFNYTGLIPINSYCFYGHKYLLYVFLTHNIYTSAQFVRSNVYLTKILNIDRDSLSSIESDPLYIESVSNIYPGGIFNRDYERILQAFSRSDKLSVSRLDITEDVSMDGRFNPLGNMVFNNKSGLFNNELTVGTVRCQSSLTDHVSKFWNIAIFVYLEVLDQEFDSSNCGSPYQYVRATNLSSASYFAQVQSITGINSGDLYSTYGRGIDLPSTNSPKPKGPSGNSGNNNNNSPKSGNKSDKNSGGKNSGK